MTEPQKSEHLHIYTAVGADDKGAYRRCCECNHKEYETDLSLPQKSEASDKLPTRGIQNRWQNMKQRCFNPNSLVYKNYGGRGITVCAGWKNSYKDFLADMGIPPKGRTIDRIDNDGGYWCGHCDECILNGWKMNCRWATKQEQMENRRWHRLSKTGVPGITASKHDAHWRVEYRNNHTRKYIGLFESFEEAVEAYVKYRIEIGIEEGCRQREAEADKTAMFREARHRATDAIDRLWRLDKDACREFLKTYVKEE